jgi:hypothetical protein
MNYISPSSNPHVSLRCIIFLFMMIAAIHFDSCKDNPVSQGSGNSGRVWGIVYDTSGHPLDSVRVYCLYSFNSGYMKVGPRSHIEKVSSVDTFGFALYQNFPNPIGNSTYLRFSIPVPCSVHITLTNRRSNEVKYSYTNSFLDGMYQLFLDNLVDSLQLQNGPYTYRFSAVGSGGQQFSGSKEAFVVSDNGSPNSVTKTDGTYFFDYDNAFVGDTVVNYTSDLYSSYNTILGSNVTLLFERRGYNSFYFNATVYPTIQFRSDIVMTRTTQ